MIPNPAFPGLGRYRTEDRTTRELRAYLRWEWNGPAGSIASLTFRAPPRAARSGPRAWAARLLRFLRGSAREPVATPARAAQAGTDGMAPFSFRPRSVPPAPVASATSVPAEMGGPVPDVGRFREAR